jgi:hypothetical protein
MVDVIDETMIGFDTVNLYLSVTKLHSINPFQFADVLEEVYDIRREDGYLVRGKISNYKVSISAAGIYLCGSLAKFYYGDVVIGLPFHHVKEALKLLGERLGVSLMDAKVTRFDVCVDIELPNLISDYLSCLGGLPRYSRYTYRNETVHYKQRNKELIFYDKSAEALKHGLGRVDFDETGKPYELDFTKRHILRCERRYMRKVSAQCKRQAVIASTLCDIEFCRERMNDLVDMYNKVEKIKEVKMNVEDVKTVREGEMLITAYALAQLHPSLIESTIADMKINGCFKSARDYYRLKKNLKELAAKAPSAERGLLDELETAFFSEVGYEEENL